MISDLPLSPTSLNLFTDLDSKLASFNRELRFIAHTLGRLRHRHHAVLVFSPSNSKQAPRHRTRGQSQSLLLDQQTPTSTIALRRRAKTFAAREEAEDMLQVDLTDIQSYGTEMLKRLFMSPRKEKFEDLESAPVTPAEWVDDEDEAASTNTDPSIIEEGRSSGMEKDAPIVDMNSPLQARMRRKPVGSARPMSYGGSALSPPIWNNGTRPVSFPDMSELDTETLIVDQRSQCLFDIPRKHISHLVSTLEAETITIPATRAGEEPRICQGIYLPNVCASDFADFLHWTRYGRIMAHQPTVTDPEYHLDASARRLISAISLAHHTLQSPAYMHAALTEFHALGHLLPYPEDFVNAIFAATNTVAPAQPGEKPKRVQSIAGLPQHSARKLIVAIVAAKTCGQGKRAVRVGPRGWMKGEDEGRVRSTTFWRMFDECVDGRADVGFGYPQTLEEVL